MISKLDIINYCLNIVGEASLNDSEEYHPHVSTITNYIENEKMKLLLTRDWWFCIRYYTLLPDTLGSIYLPNEAISVISSNDNISTVGRRVFNLNTNSFNFTNKINAKCKVDLLFEDLPELVKQVIKYGVAREFQKNFDGDSTKMQILNQDYQQGYMFLMQQDTKEKKVNLLYGDRVTSARLNNIFGQSPFGYWR